MQTKICLLFIKQLNDHCTEFDRQYHKQKIQRKFTYAIFLNFDLFKDIFKVIETQYNTGVVLNTTLAFIVYKNHNQNQFSFGNSLLLIAICE